MAMLEKILKVRGLQPPTESEMETRVLRLLRKGSFPRPERQFVVSHEGEIAGRLDFAFPERGLGIEFDSAQFHQAETDRPDELMRRNRLTLLGWRSIHVSWFDLKYQPRAILDQIRAAYEGTTPSLFVENHP
jgi:very-short-patch-repair endonuclease